MMMGMKWGGEKWTKNCMKRGGWVGGILFSASNKSEKKKGGVGQGGVLKD
jgi:hypothetical protein